MFSLNWDLDEALVGQMPSSVIYLYLCPKETQDLCWEQTCSWRPSCTLPLPRLHGEATHLGGLPHPWPFYPLLFLVSLWLKFLYANFYSFPFPLHSAAEDVYMPTFSFILIKRNVKMSLHCNDSWLLPPLGRHSFGVGLLPLRKMHCL